MNMYEKPLVEYIDFAAEEIMDQGTLEGEISTTEGAGWKPGIQSIDEP